MGRGAGGRRLTGGPGGGGSEGRGGCTMVVAVDIPAVETLDAVLELTIGDLGYIIVWVLWVRCDDPKCLKSYPSFYIRVM